ncbi:Vacuolar amino acid transporter 3, partial [Smittium culicis]
MEPDISNSKSIKTQEAELPDTRETNPLNPPKNGAKFFINSNIHDQKSTALLNACEENNKNLIFIPPANLSIGLSPSSLAGKNICNHAVGSDTSNYSSSSTNIDSNFNECTLDSNTLTEITCKQSSGELKSGTKIIDTDVDCLHDLSNSCKTDHHGSLKHHDYKTGNSRSPSPNISKNSRSLSSGFALKLNNRPLIVPQENELKRDRLENCDSKRPKKSNSFCESNGLNSENNSKFVTPLIPLYIETPYEFGSAYSRKMAASKCRHLSEGIASSFTDLVSLYENFAGGNYISEDDSDVDLDDCAYEEMLETHNQPTITITSMVNSPGYNSISRENSVSRDRSNLKASSKKAFFLLIKSFVGTGVLFLPKSFHNGGLLFSVVLMVVIAYLALHCMLLLVECHSKLKMSYGDIGYHLMGEKVRTIVLTSIIISQIGFCCAYSVFVATNTRFLFNKFTDCKMNFPLSFWILIQFIIYIPMSMVRKIKNFSTLALIANIFIFIGICYLFYYDGHVLAKYGISDIVMFNPVTFPLLIGTAVYTFEGIGLVIPVVDSMKKPSEFPKVLS